DLRLAMVWGSASGLNLLPPRLGLPSWRSRSRRQSAVIIHSENSSVHIDAVVDPLSPTGQKVALLLRVLGKYIQQSMRIVLNPLDDFSSSDFTVNGPKAFCANMPISKTLTMNLAVPEPWLVEPFIAVLYNLLMLIRLSEQTWENCMTWV
ncbi:hypothetical protein Tsubulata_022586, partial [Turnera subulata]